MDNLYKKIVLDVPWSSFKIIDGGSIIGRYLVEAFVQFPFTTSKIVSITPYQGAGFLEYANIFHNSNTIVCGQILSKEFHKSPNGDMKVLVIYV